MSVYPVEIKEPISGGTNRWGVFHSTTDTMFTPTWADEDGGELAANMFAFRYDRRRSGDYSEAAQNKLAYEIHAFLRELDLTSPSALISPDLAQKWGCDHNPEGQDVADLIRAFDRERCQRLTCPDCVETDEECTNCAEADKQSMFIAR